MHLSVKWGIFPLVLCSLSLHAQITADSSVAKQDSITHSITGYETYLEKQTIQKSVLSHLPFRNVERLSLLQCCSYYTASEAYSSLGFATGNVTVIEGMRVKNASAFPFRSIGRVALLNTQSSIQLGNAAGGIILLDAPAKADSFTAEIEFLTSAPFNSLGNYVLDLNISAPIKFKKESRVKKAMLPSFFLGLQLTQSNDLYPSAAKNYRLTDAAQADLEALPLAQSPLSDAFIVKSETLTASSFEEFDFANAPQKGAGGFAKLDIPVLKSLTLTMGTFFQLDQRREYLHAFELFNAANYPEVTTRNFDNYFRLSHTVTSKKNLKITQQLQFNFSSYFSKTQSALHEDRFFDYGYLGAFEVSKTPVYDYGEDAISGVEGWRLVGYQDTLVTFTPSSVNIILPNYTSQYFAMSGDDPLGRYQSLDQVQVNGGLLNGNRPRLPHDLWYNVGRPYNSYAERLNRDIGGHYQLNFIFKSHHIKLGAEITKSRESYYELAPIGLWELMRQLTNKHIDQLDTDNPYLVIDGVTYHYTDPNIPAFSPNDTILYLRDYNPNQQSYFDKSLRKKLGLAEDNTDFIQTDNYSPEFYSLGMFSPDELLNNGTYYAHWYGYDHLGNQFSGEPSYKDFFFEKDANGNFSRRVKAFEPSYFAGYAEYQFYSKWIDARAGLRIDRYDANQPVLRDKYLLYGARTADEVTELNGVAVTHPVGVDGDAVVYVDDMDDPTEIVGYRDGDLWFGADGNAINPLFVAKESSTGRITPYLKNPGENIFSPNFNFDNTFEEYTPEINFLPQVQLEGKPHKTTRIYFRYLSATENPVLFNRFHPADYLFFQQNSPTTVLNNPALKPLRADKIFIGVHQQVFRQFYADLSYFRYSLRNEVAIEEVAYAFPNHYYTYTNQPKRTSQGLIASLLYRSEKTSGAHAAMHYCWQKGGTFEHVVNGYVQYNFGYGSDYTGFKTKRGRMPLEGLGISIFTNIREGARYTKQDNATAEALISQTTRKILTGSLNGEQMPLFYFFDLKVEKGFSFASGKVQLSVYLWIQNLLNRKNVFKVYPYTGSAEDDGYLTSAMGQQDLDSRANPESYYDQYQMKMQNPANLDAPRIIRWGMVLTFR